MSKSVNVNSLDWITYVHKYSLTELISDGLTETQLINIKDIIGKIPTPIFEALKLTGSNFYKLFVGGGGVNSNEKIVSYFSWLPGEGSSIMSRWPDLPKNQKLQHALKLKAENSLFILDISYVEDYFWYCDSRDENPEIHFTGSDRIPAFVDFQTFAIFGLRQLFKHKIYKYRALLQNNSNQDNQKMIRNLLEWEQIAAEDMIL